MNRPYKRTMANLTESEECLTFCEPIMDDFVKFRS